MKIVLIGAGSRSFGRGQIADLLHARELVGRNVTLALVDENADALGTMARLAERMRAHTGSDIRIESATDRAKVLSGATYVFTAVARKRMELWEQDFRVPLAYGFRHCLGENGGPGALFHAMRSLELMVPICRDIERLCPNAWLFNFTNPEARVLHAVSHLTKVKAAGFCQGVFSALESISRYLDRRIDELEIHSAGINHFYSILRMVDRESGRDFLPELVTKVVQDPKAPPLFRKMAEVFGVFTFPSDDHIGEYVSFGSEFMGVKWHYGQESRSVPLHDRGRATGSLEEYADGTAPLDADILRTTGELTVPAVIDMELDRGSFRPAVNVLNTGGYIDNLPRGAAVEVPARIDAAGIHPVQVGAVPEPFAELMRRQIAINELTTEAYRTKSKKLLLQALVLDPVVTSVTAAERLLDDMLDLQKDYLPTFS